jgi:hypothetical protein
MKKPSYFILPVLSIVFGYFVGMYDVPEPKPEDNLWGSTPKSIDGETARELVNNYTGEEKYMYLSNELIDQLVKIRKNQNSDGAAIYFASNVAESSAYNKAVLVVYKNMTTNDKYFEVDATTANAGLCPKICDIAGELSPEGRE